MRNTMRTAVVIGAIILTAAFASPANAGQSVSEAVTGPGQSSSVNVGAAVQPLATASLCTSSRAFALKSDPGEHAQVPTIGTSKSCNMWSGNTSAGIATLQNTLNACYGKSLATDGIFGAGTKNALIQVQKAIGVTADGIYGPSTRDKMKFKNSINLACSPASDISNTIW